MGFSYSATNTFIKTHYRDLFHAKAAEMSPFLAALRKKKARAAGKTVNHTILYANAGVTSAQLSSTIVGYAASAGSVEVQLAWKECYSVGNISALQLSLMKQSKDSYIDGVTELQSQLTENIIQRLSGHLFGQGYGVLGQVSSGWSSGTITLEDKSLICNFEVGQYLTFTSDLDGDTSAATTYVTAVDRSAGTITVNSTSGIAASDYIWSPGDSPEAALSAIGTAGGKVMPGMQVWFPCPSAASTRALQTGDAYMVGCTRTADDARLVGAYYYGAADTSREECFNAALYRMNRINGAKPDFLVANPEQVGAFVSELGSKVQYGFLPARGVDGPVADVGFETIVIHGPGGKVNVISDPFCPVNMAWAGRLEDIHLLCVNGEVPELFDDDGNIILRVASSTNYQMITQAFCTLAVDKPSSFCAIVPPTITL